MCATRLNVRVQIRDCRRALTTIASPRHTGVTRLPFKFFVEGREYTG
jgi:hypothetical protein